MWPCMDAKGRTLVNSGRFATSGRSPLSEPYTDKQCEGDAGDGAAVGRKAQLIVNSFFDAAVFALSLMYVSH